jgi:AhpD family alkylhydroperoxidase
MLGVEKYIRQSGLEESLLNLIRMRASQINGCAYCLDMHWKDARALGESEQRLYGLDAWEESPYYTDRERAALAWTEAVTNVRDTREAAVTWAGYRWRLVMDTPAGRRSRTLAPLTYR